MFDQMSLRVVASMLLWSVAAVLLGVWYYNLTFAKVSGVPEPVHVKQNLDCLVAGGFFGLFFGALIGWPKRPFNVHAIAAIGAIVAVPLSANVDIQNWPFADQPNYNGLIVAGVTIAACGLTSLAFRNRDQGVSSASCPADGFFPPQRSDPQNDRLP